MWRRGMLLDGNQGGMLCGSLISAAAGWVDNNIYDIQGADNFIKGFDINRKEDESLLDFESEWEQTE
jgi:hypothetical protein